MVPEYWSLMPVESMATSGGSEEVIWWAFPRSPSEGMSFLWVENLWNTFLYVGGFTQQWALSNTEPLL